MGETTLDALVFSSGWVGLAAGALVLAVAAGLGASPAQAGPVAALAFAGTFAVYNVDRLRDLERDRATAPERTAFVAAHRRVLAAAAGALGLVALGLAAWAGPAPVVLCGAVLLPGLLHRRLKSARIFKTVYITAAWVTVVVGLPALSLRTTGPGGHERWAWCVAALAPALLANVIASNVRDAENAGGPAGARRSLRIGLAMCGVGAAASLCGPADIRPLAAIPLCVAASLAAFRPTERYGLVVVDGALLVGALASLALS